MAMYRLRLRATPSPPVCLRDSHTTIDRGIRCSDEHVHMNTSR